MKKIKFDEICPKEFGDGFNGRTFVADVNFTLAAIACLNKDECPSLNKDDIEILSNEISMLSIKMETDTDAFDDIFGELSDEGLIETFAVGANETLPPNEVIVTEKLKEEIQKKYGEIIF